MSALQDLGYNVDVLVSASNACKSKAQLLRVASGLRVSLKMEQLNFHKVTMEGIHIKVRIGASHVPLLYAVASSQGLS